MPTDKIQFTSRLPEDLLKDLKIIAKEEDRSVNNLIEHFLRVEVNKYFAEREY